MNNITIAQQVLGFIQMCYNDTTSDFELHYKKGIAVVGAHFGDCGKGKFDDLIIRKYKEEGYKENRRYIYNDTELTSRVSSDRIPYSLQALGYQHKSNDDDPRPVDICLATNMISVGVDVPRLGLMTVAGQPKTTSEYIQATSRVGRNAKDAPGLVITVYNPGKPRDRSHYEHFKSYHSKVYCNVEPTSVTPFVTTVAASNIAPV